MSHNIYIYIFVMAGVTYLIRLLPLTIIRKEIKNTFIRSFLYYVPYVTPVSYTHLDVYKRQRQRLVSILADDIKNYLNGTPINVVS